MLSAQQGRFVFEPSKAKLPLIASSQPRTNTSRAAVSPSVTMATRTLEARFEHMSVHDENEPLGDGTTKVYSKSKVRIAHRVVRHIDEILTAIGDCCLRIFTTTTWRQSTEPLQGRTSIADQQHCRHVAFTSRPTESRSPCVPSPKSAS